ncbi:MAG: CCA tRNA nucleotidyltransferase [Synechococcaceae cyanobacterium]|nr:CCA tRNA nucleotidyltransferase [Synechococcaceae cyanobacterium]
MSTPSATGLPGIPPQVLEHLARAAGGDRLALVGGAVRDLLLHRIHNDPWRGVPDLDLVVAPGKGDRPSAGAPAGDALLPAAHRLARRLSRALGPAVVQACREHGAFGTVELELLLEEGPLLLDVATARREWYPQPAENPRVSFGALEDDLARRDFTINAMALVLTGEAEPELLDPHGGRNDLELRQLRFLHPGSVRDDPTRVLRGARYRARMGFALAPGSLSQVRGTLARWPWPWRPGDPPAQAPPALGTRLRMALELLLAHDSWPEALAALQEWEALPLLDAALQQDRRWRLRLQRARRFGLPLLPALLVTASDPLALAERLQLPHRQHRLLAQVVELGERLAGAGDAATSSWPPSRWCALLERTGLRAEAVALALAAGIGPRRPLLRWWCRWRHVRAPVGAEDLLAAGFRPGPALGERLRQLRAEQLDRHHP